MGLELIYHPRGVGLMDGSALAVHLLLYPPFTCKLIENMGELTNFDVVTYASMDQGDMANFSRG